MPFKNKDLGWIRFNFKKEADSVLDNVRSRTPIAPVDWYEELDEETKEAYNKEVLNRTANTYSAIYNLSQEEENDYRKRFDIDYTAFIKSPIAEHELIKQIMDFVKELIGDYRWGEWLGKMNIKENEDLYQKKIKSWALFSDSILEKIYQEIDDEHELDYKWNELSSQAISPDQQFAIDYFYNYRKMELGLDYNDKLIGKMELRQTVNELKEAAIGFRPDATSKTQSQVRLIMSNLEQAIEYLQNNAFVKNYDGDKLSTIKDESDKAMDALNSLMQTVHSTPDSKKGKVGFRETQEIRLKNYKPLGEEKTWADTFGDKSDELAAKQRGFAINDPVLMKARAAAEKKKQKVEPRINPDYKALKNAPKIKALEKQRAQLMRDMEQEAEPEGGPIADRYGRALNKIDDKIANLKESINEDFKKGDSVIVDKIVGMTHAKQSDARRFNGKKGIVNGTQDDYVYVRLKGFKSPSIEFHKNELKLAESINEDKEWSTYEQRMVNQIKAAQKEARGIYTLPMKTQEFYRKHKDELGVGFTYFKHDPVNEAAPLLKQSKLSSAEYQKAKKLKGFNSDDYDWDGEQQLYIKKSVNENIETLLSPEDLKYFRAHRDEIMDMLSAEFRSSKLSAKDAVEKHKAMKEGTCGYDTDAKTGKKFKTPGGLEERIKTLVKEFTKQK